MCLVVLQSLNSASYMSLYIQQIDNICDMSQGRAEITSGGHDLEITIPESVSYKWASVSKY